MDVPGLVEHLFRTTAGRLVARLTRILGPAHLDLAEDVVQEALLKAMRVWPYGGIPDNPAGWLARVARNLAVDALRRQSLSRDKLVELAAWGGDGASAAAGAPARFDDELDDDRLRLIFACCHPAIPGEARAALTLKTACGFGVAEIARALLAPEAAIAQRIVRAKAALREQAVACEVPGPGELHARLDGVLEVLYLLFNEGYGAHAGENLVRAELVEEALRSMRLLAAHPRTAVPRTHALLALMLLQGARLPARLGDRGELLLLSEQDRARWDASRIAEGFAELERAGSGDELSAYHLEAAIAACHVSASVAGGATDWPRILHYYDLLAEIAPSPVVRLNRCVALAMARGAEAGLSALAEVEGARELRDYYLLPATKAELLARIGRFDEAAACWERALGMECSDPERDYLRRKLDGCRGAQGEPHAPEPRR